MEDLFKKIYKNVIYYEDEAIHMDKEINKKIEKYINLYENKLTKSEKEQLKSILYKISYDAEESGFYLGIKYCIKTFIEIGFK